MEHSGGTGPNYDALIFLLLGVAVALVFSSDRDDAVPTEGGNGKGDTRTNRTPGPRSRSDGTVRVRRRRVARRRAQPSATPPASPVSVPPAAADPPAPEPSTEASEG